MRHYCFLTGFILFSCFGCGSSVESRSDDTLSRSDDTLSRYDVFIQSQLITEGMQLEMMSANQYYYFDSITLKGILPPDSLEKIVQFRLQCENLLDQLNNLKSKLVAETENVQLSVADTLRTSMMSHLNEPVDIALDTILALNEQLWGLEEVGNALSYDTDHKRSYVQPPDYYDKRNTTFFFWGDAALKNVSLQESITSIYVLRNNIRRFELEILLRVRAGLDNAPWHQN